MERCAVPDEEQPIGGATAAARASASAADRIPWNDMDSLPADGPAPAYPRPGNPPRERASLAGGSGEREGLAQRLLRHGPEPPRRLGVQGPRRAAPSVRAGLDAGDLDVLEIETALAVELRGRGGEELRRR